MAAVRGAVVRDADLVTRFGWEEFAVILPNTKYDDARKAHHRAQAALAACMQELQNVTISSGLAELSEERLRHTCQDGRKCVVQGQIGRRQLLTRRT